MRVCFSKHRCEGLQLCEVAAALVLVTASPHVQNIHCINSRAVRRGRRESLAIRFFQNGFPMMRPFTSSETAYKV